MPPSVTQEPPRAHCPTAPPPLPREAPATTTTRIPPGRSRARLALRGAARSGYEPAPAPPAMAAASERPLVRFERRGPVAILTLDAPPVNVLSRDVLAQLGDRLSQAEADEQVRAIVLASASERAFAAGANIREMAPLDSRGARAHGARGQAITRQIERSPLPVIAAVNGVCLGGGCEVVLSCDFVLASEDASFGQPEIVLGIMPGWGGTQRLPRVVGLANARRWILTGRPVTAHEAARQGLVERVVPRSELLPAAVSLGEELATRAPLALAAAKYALRQTTAPHIDTDLRYELGLWVRLFGTEDQREGMRAFLEKRPVTAGPRKEWSSRSRGFPWSRSASRGVSRPRRRGGKRKN